MTQKSEQINLEYKVEFEDGLRPRVAVYGIDSEGIYIADAYIGISVGAGFHLRLPNKEEERKDVGAVSNIGKTLSSFLIIRESRDKSKKNWEQKMLKCAREIDSNVIKVQSRKHIESAIRRHNELYGEQFYELEEKFLTLFREFIAEHPGYR